MEDQTNQLMDVNQEDDDKVVYVITDIDNPASAINLTSNIPHIHEAIKRVIVEAPDLLTMDEGTFKKTFNGGITATMSRVRMSFWQEYEAAVTSGRKMYFSRIIGGVCGDTYFRDKFLTDNKKVAFMLTPPSDYLVQTKEALMAGLETIREIVSARVVDEDGILIPRAADVVLKAFMHLDMRVKGAIIQRIDQRTLALNVNQNMGANSPQLKVPRTLEELDTQLAEIKKQLGMSTAHPPELQLAEMRDVVDVQKEVVSQASGGYKLSK